MKKAFIFSLGMSGLIGMGETANAVATFSCPETLDVSKFNKGHIIPSQSSYIYRPATQELFFGADYVQTVSPALTITWNGGINAHAVRDSKEYNLESATLKSAEFGYLDGPVCEYKFDFSGLIFSTGTTYFNLFLAPRGGAKLYDCTLSGTTFTCQESKHKKHP
ncbi:MAG TPA: hypothetical protein VMW10_03145 [Alphaproteobacteria bacterium]|nr:hypothetical protein [Alphaproteobacteria bacterium]